MRNDDFQYEEPSKHYADGSPKIDKGIEVVAVDAITGGRKATKLEQPALIPAKALSELATHYGLGAMKYDANNWRNGYDWSLSYNALQRHLNAFWAGENYDSGKGGTGSKHVIAAAFHCLALATFIDEHSAGDDRWKPKS